MFGLRKPILFSVFTFNYKSVTLFSFYLFIFFSKVCVRNSENNLFFLCYYCFLCVFSNTKEWHQFQMSESPIWSQQLKQSVNLVTGINEMIPETILMKPTPPPPLCLLHLKTIFFTFVSTILKIIVLLLNKSLGKTFLQNFQFWGHSDIYKKYHGTRVGALVGCHTSI